MNSSSLNRAGSSGPTRWPGMLRDRPTPLAAAAIAALSWLVAPLACAAPAFQILPAPPGTIAIQPEAVADAGGTSYTSTVWPNGTGLPTAMGGWPLVSGTYPPGFGIDLSFSGSFGITGFHSANLYLTQEALVTFEFGGSGDANYQNQFYVNGVLLYDNKTTSTTGPNPKGPYLFQAGFIPFSYIANVTGSNSLPTTLIVNGSNTADPATAAAFFLGFDPYAVSGTYTTSGTAAVYVGLTDHAEGVGDHDYQDLTVKIKIVGVPEPGTLALAAIGASGAVAAIRRRRVRRASAWPPGRDPTASRR